MPIRQRFFLVKTPPLEWHLSKNSKERLRLTSEPRSPIDPDPNVCRFYGRCPRGVDACRMRIPMLRLLESRQVACHFAEEFLSPT
jgi:ABC-type dipeptide/oligopeptide/nickel transport system ATPase component